jgi:hypothetical protein
MTPKKPMGRPRGTNPPPRYTVRLPASLVSPDQRDWLEQEAERQGITLAALIRQWIDEKRAEDA